MQIPDQSQVSQWLEHAGIEYYQCGHCDGLHFSDCQNLDGVAESRLFVEQDGLLISTELDIRLSALMALNADLNNLNINFPTLKLFADVVDEAPPQLVVSAFFHTGVGISEEQFLLFVSDTLEKTRAVINECSRLDYLTKKEASATKRSLH